MKKLTALALLCAIFQWGYSQNKTRTQLIGKITDAKTGQPLAGASVQLSDAKLGTVTNAQGIYSFRNAPMGHAEMEVSYLGYETIVEHIDISAASEKNFQMVRSVREYEGVTVTGVSGATSIRKTPIPVSKINKAELFTTPSTNIIDALSRQPGVSQLSTGPAISKPVIRGLGYNRLVTINDGVRQEGQQWGDEHGIEIDENSVSRVEILKGPASLMYGSDAIAGVVNIITTTPAPNNSIVANVSSSYQTNNRQRSLFANIGGNRNGFNWNVWGDLTAAADYKNKYDGRVFNSKFNNHNFGGYVGYNGAWGFTHLIVSSFNQKLGVVEGERNNDGSFVKALPGGIDGAPTSDDFNSTTPEIPYQYVRHNKIIADNSFKVGSGKITLNLAYQRNQRQEFGNPDDISEKSLYFDLGTFNYSAAYHFDDHNGWITSVGVNGMSQDNKNKGVEFLIPEYHLFDFGAYVYSQKTINKATISGGLRFDNRAVDSKALMDDGEAKFNAFKKNFSNVSATAGVSYAPKKNVTLKANIARGFRAPGIPELSSNGAHEGTNRYEYGDQNLKSETTLQGDVGVEIGTEHLLLSVSAFYNHIDNFIFYSKLSSGQGGDSLVAADGAMIPAYKFGQHTANLPGFEAMLDIHPHPLDWLHWENTFSYVRGRFTEAIGESKNVPFVPPARWTSEVKVALFPKAKSVKHTSLFAEVVHAFDQNRPFTSFETETVTDGYTLLNAGVSASLFCKGKTLFTIAVLGNNLADVAYQDHLSRLKYTDVNVVTGRQGVFNRGRNFMIKVNVPLEFDN
jgi:iron complex outermembrane receptor protein